MKNKCIEIISNELSLIQKDIEFINLKNRKINRIKQVSSKIGLVIMTIGIILFTFVIITSPFFVIIDPVIIFIIGPVFMIIGGFLSGRNLFDADYKDSPKYEIINKMFVMRNKGIIRQWLESENYSDIIKSYGVVNESLSNQIICLLFTKYNNNTINDMIESFLSGLVRIEYCSNIKEEVFDLFLVKVKKELENNNYHNYHVLYDLATNHFYELFDIYKVKYYVNEQKYLEDNFNKYMKTYNTKKILLQDMKTYITKKILLQEIYAYVEKFFETIYTKDEIELLKKKIPSIVRNTNLSILNIKDKLKKSLYVKVLSNESRIEIDQLIENELDKVLSIVKENKRN